MERPGDLDFKPKNASVTAGIAGLANLTFGLKELAVNGLNTWGQFDVFEPLGPVSLQTRTETGVFQLGIEVALNLTTTSASFPLISLLITFKEPIES